MTCIFCDIVDEKAPATILRRWDDAVAIRPLNPVTPGHTLIIPKKHVRDALSDPEVSAATMRRAAEYAETMPDLIACNIITSVGHLATQTVMHLHLHVVPREPGDGLKLPWTDQK